jgi:hypothetical protein
MESIAPLIKAYEIRIFTCSSHYLISWISAFLDLKHFIHFCEMRFTLPCFPSHQGNPKRSPPSPHPTASPLPAQLERWSMKVVLGLIHLSLLLTPHATQSGPERCHRVDGSRSRCKIAHAPHGGWIRSVVALHHGGR